jgi:phage FluMu protein Com
MDEGERTIAIKCPCCSHRLFDMRTDTHGTIKIKCPRCKTVMAVRMMGKNRMALVKNRVDGFHTTTSMVNSRRDNVR